MSSPRPGGDRPSERQGAVRPDAPTMHGAPIFAAHNDFGTAVLLAAMERAGVRRLVLGSSVSVYGEGCYRAPRSGPYFPGMRRRADLDRGMFDHRAPRTGEILTWEPVGEDAPLRPRTAYAASKLAQEHYALAWGATTGGAVTVLRYHHIYGDPVAGGAALAAHSGVAARFRAELEAGRAPFVFEDGGQIRDFVHVRDVAAATVAAVHRPLPGFVPLNIASGHPITLWEVASIMSRARGGPHPVVSGQYRVTDVRHIAAHPERAHRALGFAPAIAPAQGLTDYAKAPDTTRP
ncbi:NAD-dependent epimerase/dehydratase family protein [Nocardia wallacei]|uniref:NAD-dependent epimerase/dehydratase family protein n=1 Tax=Nocardia wallacei TaxID=480035 RepID=UPI003CC7F457